MLNERKYILAAIRLINAELFVLKIESIKNIDSKACLNI